MRHSRFISSTPLIAGLLTGVMKTVRDKEVFVVRSVKANGKPTLCALSTGSRCRHKPVNASPRKG
jgi:hypothetical protein